MVQINISTKETNSFVDITRQIQEVIGENRWRNGVLYLNILHTTAGITINENADPDVQRDMIRALDVMVPDIDYKHFEGNSPAHIKSSMMGTTLTIPVVDGEMVLGTWQGVYFCEFDGPRRRKVHITFLV